MKYPVIVILQLRKYWKMKTNERLFRYCTWEEAARECRKAKYPVCQFKADDLFVVEIKRESLINKITTWLKR